MFERFRMVLELKRVVSLLKNSKSCPVSPEVLTMLEPYFDRGAEAMRECKYDPQQAVVRMVTSLAVFGEKVGANAAARQRNPSLYRDFQNLYQYCQLAFIKDPDRVGDAFCIPKEGDPEPFTVSLK